MFFPGSGEVVAGEAVIVLIAAFHDIARIQVEVPDGRGIVENVEFGHGSIIIRMWDCVNGLEDHEIPYSIGDGDAVGDE